MYEYIKGEIAELTPTYAIIEAGGVGYYIIISLQTYSSLENKKSAKLYTHYIVRDDAQILHGFSTKQERELFRLLISVSRVGGATARMILSTYSTQETVNLIAGENAEMLSTVRGLGKKTSEKIIVELRDKVGEVLQPSETVGGAKGEKGGKNFEEAMAALQMLGFAKRASEKTLQEVMRKHPSASVEEIIRLSLKSL